jgi:hypothetical protein
MALWGGSMSAVLISRNVASLGQDSGQPLDLELIAFECDSHLRELGPDGFSGCLALRSIALPPRLVTISDRAFAHCESLKRLVIPASVTAIGSLVFQHSGVRSIEIEEGSVSFRVVNELLVDFGVRSLVLVIGVPASILIPSSIEELRPFCCAESWRLKTVEWESNSNLRCIDQSAFFHAFSLKSIVIPSSVEVLRERCFGGCSGLRTVACDPGSKLRLIERNAFEGCRRLESVSLPASARVIDR